MATYKFSLKVQQQLKFGVNSLPAYVRRKVSIVHTMNIRGIPIIKFYLKQKPRNVFDNIISRIYVCVYGRQLQMLFPNF